jgi:hypothetical protein
VTKAAATSLSRRIRRESMLEPSLVWYGRGLWTVHVVDAEEQTESEYITAESWENRKPARSWPIGNVPKLLNYPNGLLIDTAMKRHNASMQRFWKRLEKYTSKRD